MIREIVKNVMEVASAVLLALFAIVCVGASMDPGDISVSAFCAGALMLIFGLQFAGLAVLLQWD